MSKKPVSRKGSNKSNFSPAKTVKSLAARAKRRPVVALSMALLFMVVVGTGSYQLLGGPHVQNDADIKSDIKATLKQAEAIKKPEAAPTPVADPAPQAVAAEQAQSSKAPSKASPSPATDDEPAKNVGGVMSKPGCYAGCATPHPSYSIVMPGAVTVAAGTTVGPFTASTSNGSSVDWTTPQYNGSGFGPYGYTNGSMNATPSLRYYIRAEQNVAPGTYTLYMSAIQSSTQTLVKTSMTITVTP